MTTTKDDCYERMLRDYEHGKEDIKLESMLDATCINCIFYWVGAESCGIKGINKGPHYSCPSFQATTNAELKWRLLVIKCRKDRERQAWHKAERQLKIEWVIDK